MLIPSPITIKKPAKNTNGGCFYLLDPSFRGAQGGSMTFGGGVASAANQQNIAMKMAVNADMEPGSQANYNAQPIFSVAPQLAQIRYKPIGTDATRFFETYQKDLGRLASTLTPADVLWDYYLLGPMQVVAYANWLERIPERTRPRVMVGVDVYNSHWYNWIAPVKGLLKQLEPWLRITTTSFTHKALIENQLGVKVQLMPRPLMSRVGQGLSLDNEMVEIFEKLAGGPVVGFFTDATKLKSFDLLADCVAGALQKTDLRFCIQVRGGPNDEACAESHRGLIELAVNHPNRIVLFNGPLANQAYKTAVELCDGIIIAYDPGSHFADTPSGTMCEAFAAGTVPLVIKGSSMARELEIFDITIPMAEQQDSTSFAKLFQAFALEHVQWMQDNKKEIDDWNEFQSYRNMFNHVFDVSWQ
jgi:hypothetical protein